MGDEGEEIYDAPASGEGVGNFRTLIARFDQKGHAYAPGAAMAAKSMAKQQDGPNGGPPEIPKKPFKPPMSPTGAQMFAIPKGDLLSRRNNLTVQHEKRASAARSPSNAAGDAKNKPKPPAIAKKPPVLAPKPGAKPNLSKPVNVAPVKEKENPNTSLLRREPSEANKENRVSRKSSRALSNRRISTPGAVLVGSDGKKYRMRPVPKPTGPAPAKPPLPQGPIVLPQIKRARVSRAMADNTDVNRTPTDRPISIIPTMTEEEEEEFERRKRLNDEEPQEIYDDVMGPEETYDDTRIQDDEEQELYEDFNDLIDQETKKLDTTKRATLK